MCPSSRVELVLVPRARRHLDEDDDVGHCATPACRSARRAGRRTRSVSRSTPTCAFAARLGALQRSTTVRPRQSSDSQLDLDVAVASSSTRPGPDHVRDGDRVVDRGAVPAVRLAVVDGEEVDEVGDEGADRARVARSRCCTAGVVTARCVTSRPIIVTSSPAWKTRCGGLGVGPDVELGRRRHVPLGDRAAHQHDPLDVVAVRARRGSSATFVSGPVGTSVTGSRAPTMRSTMKSTACSSSGATARRRAASGPSRPLSPWTCAATASSRASGRSAPAATGTSVRSDEVEHAQRVRGRLLERLVAVHRRDAEQLELGAREREQERDRVVVPRVAVEDDRGSARPVMPASIASTSAAVGSDGWAPRRDAASAPAAQARRSASSRSRPSSSETSRQAVNASPAAVPSTASTGGGAARATSSPSSSRTAPSAPSVSATRPSRAHERLELVAVDDGEVGVDGDRARRRGVEAERCPPPAPRRETTASSGISSWQSTASAAAARRSPSVAFAPGRDDDRRLARRVDRISATPVGASRLAQPRARRRPRAARRAPRRRTRRGRRRRPASRRRRAARRRPPGSRPCRPGRARSVAPVTVSPGRGSRSHARDEVEVDRADDDDRWRRVTRAQASPTAASAHAQGPRSSTVEPSSVSRRSKSPAQSEERSGARVEPGGVGEALERAHEHGQLEVDRRDAVRARADAGARRAPGRHSTSSPAPGPAVPRAALGPVGLELEQVADERRLEPGERRLDAVGRVAERRLARARPSPGSASPRPQRSSSRQKASAAASHARSCADEPPRRAPASPPFALEHVRPSPASALDLDHHGEDHRPAARAVVDELPDRVVEVLLEQLDLGDAVREPAPPDDPLGLVAQLVEQLLVLAEAARDQLRRRDRRAAVVERDAS